MSRKFPCFMVAVELGSNPKIGRLTDAQFACLLKGVWPLAAKALPRGYLVVAGEAVTAADVAYQARCSVPTARATLETLRKMGMVECDEESGFEFCHDWWTLNPDPKADRTGAERQRRYRNAHSNGTVTPTVTASPTVPRNGSVTPPEVEGELEVEVEVPANAGSPRKRATRRVNQSVPPDDFPENKLPVLEDVLTLLRGAHALRGGIDPEPRGVGLGMQRNLRADHVAVARKLVQWLTAGKGQHARCADIAARFGDWVSEEPNASQPESRAALVPIRGGKQSAGDLIAKINANRTHGLELTDGAG